MAKKETKAQIATDRISKVQEVVLEQTKLLSERSKELESILKAIANNPSDKNVEKLWPRYRTLLDELYEPVKELNSTFFWA